MAGEVIRRKATKTQSGNQEHKPTKRRTHSGYRADKFVPKNFQKPYRCDGCREEGYGRRYIRIRKTEIVELHKECLFPSSTTSPKCLPGYNFEFLDLGLEKKPVKGERYCQACGKDVNRFVYHCKAKGWYLHPTCCNLEKKIEISAGVEFQLCCNMVKKTECLFCKKKLRNGVQGIPGWFYVSKTERGSCLFHAYCYRKWFITIWKKIGPEDDKRLALKKMVRAEFNDDGGGKKVGKMILMIGADVLEIFVSILLGDPTTGITKSIIFVLAKLLQLSKVILR